MEEKKYVSQVDAEGFFIGEVEADPSPLEQNVFLIPRGCVDKRGPSLAENQCAKLVDEQWEVMPDFLGTVYWNEHLEPVKITQRGIAPPDGAYLTYPGPTKTVRLVALKTSAKDQLQSADRVAIRCFKAGVAYPESWRTYDASLRAIVQLPDDADPDTFSVPTAPDYPAGT